MDERRTGRRDTGWHQQGLRRTNGMSGQLYDRHSEGTLTNVLDTQEVLPRLEAGRDGDVDIAGVDE